MIIRVPVHDFSRTKLYKVQYFYLTTYRKKSLPKRKKNRDKIDKELTKGTKRKFTKE